MSSDVHDPAPVAIRVHGLHKCFQIYATPGQRLRQFVLPRLRRWLGLNAVNYYREFWALRDVSFEINKGQTIGIIGRNGSGKSTLLQIICGTLHPTQGGIEVQGRVAALLELGSGFNPEFTGRENVFFNAGVLGQSEERTREKFADIENFADIGEFMEQPVKTYSSGMLVRLAFAVIAHVDADILVIDEALAVGDAFFTQKCMRFLRGFMQHGTVLFVSHDTAAVKSLCDRVIWIDKGQIIESGQAKEVCDLYLQAFYEAQQGKGGQPPPKALPRLNTAALPLHDQRRDFINSTHLRNDIKVFEFRPDSSSFGERGGTISKVQLLDVQGRPLSWVIGGESVRLRVEVECHMHLRSPIVGFYVNDRTGQALFGDNTCLVYMDDPQPCDPGEKVCATFSFEMPRMPVGDYTITVALADGTQQEHIQHHWIHDALQFKSESTSASAGLVGIPMRHISLDVSPNRS
ncbi:ABC transporter ATP-binding protein [Rhodococcus sp. SRB_17]|uniref:ABC transporter ATP-binding protein n=1 Tax=Acidovorax sp. SRB_24 TaxID=1962700 RepID=UPI00145D96E6|nr:ABC transporter ATP-binding protein [Acidovorax sp. SRB_24]NMM77922.1 ABC transporter ATP-binding protein [Acidovorax sp. SRB_24]NMM89742.1 ABC transporter ATP-binding protein [Rhodococcus sp. SRB_17]